MKTKTWKVDHHPEAWMAATNEAAVNAHAKNSAHAANDDATSRTA